MTDRLSVERAEYEQTASAEGRHGCGGRSWTAHEEFILTLDDGRQIEFGAWGYDAWGATVGELS